MAAILGVGNATLDIVNLVERYPEEDVEVRAVGQQLRRGGNTANSLVALSQLGHDGAWAGTVADEPDAAHILDDLRRHRIALDWVHHVSEGKVPTSYIALSKENGSRTIVHYRDLPEYPKQAFEAIPLESWDWIHFEGRNLPEITRMLIRVRKQAPGLPCSIEIEKPRENIEALFALADVLLFSKVYARSRGYETAAELLEAVREEAPHAMLVCAWGEAGAWGMDRNGTLHETAAFPPERVVDTIGAGDVFNAGIIDGLLREMGLGEALTHAARLAGLKCGQEGLRLLRPV